MTAPPEPLRGAPVPPGRNGHEATTSGALTLRDTIPSSSHTTTGHPERAWFQHLQALEDVIAYRRARVTAPCPDCAASGHRCDDHACDLNLIADYQQTAMTAILDMPSRIDAIQPGGSPLTAPGDDPAGLRDETRPAGPALP